MKTIDDKTLKLSYEYFGESMKQKFLAQLVGTDNIALEISLKEIKAD